MIQAGNILVYVLCHTVNIFNLMLLQNILLMPTVKQRKTPNLPSFTFEISVPRECVFKVASWVKLEN